jgi:glycosyltransferase involved in cell wall biosynthesis
VKKKCAVFTNIAPVYSRPLWYEMSSSRAVDYTFYSSRKGFSGIKTIDINESNEVSESGRLKWVFLRNIYIRSLLLYQSGIIFRCLITHYDAYILYGEMHSISNWIAALICKLRKKPLLFWGHGLYGNERYLKKAIRLMYYKIADYHLVYGNRSRKLMIESGFKPEKVYTVYNSLDYSAHKLLYAEKNQNDLDHLRTELFPNKSTSPVIIFIGRLIKAKKISYLLEAIYLSKEKGNMYNCLIVGNGIELDNLRQMALSLEISDRVYFYGSCYDEKINGNLLMLADCCVSPGNVGLTAIHSLSLGTPVITHGNILNQGPEAESVIQNETGLFFEDDNVASLSDAIDDMILNKKKMSMEAYCIEQVNKYWNPENQAAIFDQAVLDSVRSH